MFLKVFVHQALESRRVRGVNSTYLSILIYESEIKYYYVHYKGVIFPIYQIEATKALTLAF